MKLIFVDESNQSKSSQKIDQTIFESILQAASTCETLPGEESQSVNLAPGQKLTKNKSVELLLTTDSEIQELNKRYRQKDQPTDVLSFPSADTPSAENEESLGQIVISVDKAKAQAKQLNQTLEEELKFLFAHGLLHLLGHDHQTPEDEEKMLAETYKLLGREQTNCEPKNQ